VILTDNVNVINSELTRVSGLTFNLKVYRYTKCKIEAAFCNNLNGNIIITDSTGKHAL